jgi:hypothetical protein
VALSSSPEVVFRQACCPAFTITTNGKTGIRQDVQKNAAPFFDGGIASLPLRIRAIT